MKTCTRCKTPKPFTEFYKCRSFRDGLQLWCKACTTEANEEIRRRKGVLPAQIYLEQRREAARRDKACIICGVVKPLEEFHKNKTTASGRTNICRACRPEYDRQAWVRKKQNPEWVERRRISARESMRRRRKLPLTHLKEHARQMVMYALKAGLLSKKPCEECGAVDVQGHHIDYTKPLEVKWLCTRCLGREHAQSHMIT